MRTYREFAVPVLGVLILAVLLFQAFPGAGPALATDTGTLKLKVSSCAGGTWLQDATIDVEIWRSGYGTVTTDSGTTDSSGYIEFEFTVLEEGDEARVTVTPSGGGDADGNHTYTWSPNRGGYFDIGLGTYTICSDSYYDVRENIIECVYN